MSNDNKFDIFGMTTSPGGGGDDHSGKMFLDPGINKSDPLDIKRLVRSGIFESYEEINNYVMFISKCIRTGCMDGLRDATEKENAKAAIKGRAGTLALQYGIGAMSPDVILDTTNGKLSGLKRLFRNNRRSDKNHNENNGYPVNTRSEE